MLIAAGADLRRINGRGAISFSSDGVAWSDPTDPFDGPGLAMGISKGTSLVIAIDAYGGVSSSSDLVSWSPARLGDGSFSPTAIDHGITPGHDDIWMICGQKKFMSADGPYAQDDEAGQIYRNLTGNNEDWELVYSDQSIDSRFYGIRRVVVDGLDSWIACGSAGGAAEVLWSIDDGVTWSRVALPGNIGIPCAYDAVVANGQVWISCKGRVLSCPDAQLDSPSPTWDSSGTALAAYAQADLVKIAANSFGHIAAAASGGIYYTTDGITWQWFSEPGYRFRSIFWFEDKQSWYAGADSNLMRYTLWTSTNTTSWTPGNNLVQAYDFCRY